jgi:hypothetical protein
MLFGAGPAALRDAGVTTLAEAYHLDIEDITTIGPDLRITAAVRGRASGASDGAGAPAAPSRREH